MRWTGRRNSGQIYKAAFATAAAALAFSLMVAASLRLGDALRPQDGDIITFTPGESVTTRATLIATRVGGSPNASCVLDPKMMLQSGGSLVIEATEANGSRRYRVHWAGGRTSNSGTNCGASADLLLRPGDLAVLFLVGNPLDETLGSSRPGGGGRSR